MSAPTIARILSRRQSQGNAMDDAVAQTSPAESPENESQARPGQAQQAPSELHYVQTWMARPLAKFHTGRRNRCETCSAWLRYTQFSSWDDYIGSEAFLEQLYNNIANDRFISSLLCGDNYYGDLPTEHRLTKQKIQKLQHNVQTSKKIMNAGYLDGKNREKTIVRLLEQLLVESLPTSAFTNTLERRCAAIINGAAILAERRLQSQRLYQPLPSAGPAPDVQLHQLGICMLQSLIGSFDFSGEKAALPFQELLKILNSMGPLSMMPYWAPPRDAPEAKLKLLPGLVTASSSATGSTPRSPEMAIDRSMASYWSSAPRPGTVTWTVQLTDNKEEVELSSMTVRWRGKEVPECCKIQVARAGKNGGYDFFRTVALYTYPDLPGRVGLGSVKASALRLEMSGLPKANKDGIYSIEEVQIFVPAGGVYVDPVDTMMQFDGWLCRAWKEGAEGVKRKALEGLSRWALATGALTSVLQYVQCMLLPTVSKNSPSDEKTTYPSSILSILRSRIKEREREIEKQKRTKHNSPSRVIKAGFDPSLCSSGVTVEEGTMTVRTREGSAQHAIVNVGFASGRACWEFRLDEDTPDDEMTCFGAAILPVSSSAYDTSSSLWMLRGYNGCLYARGLRVNLSMSRVHPGDVVRVEVDMDEGTLSYAVNGDDQGIAFNDLAGFEVYPAVSFYGTGKVITLQKVESSSGLDRAAIQATPVYLSSQQEWESYVGHGSFGRRGVLGYDPEDGGEARVKIAGKRRSQALSLHPPREGTAFVSYDLSRRYRTLEGAVAINDDVPRESMRENGTSVSFSVLGDDVEIWRSSSALSQPGEVLEFNVDVSDVMTLELRATCPGSNVKAHAVYVDPFVLPHIDWTCNLCKFKNAGALTSCASCGDGKRKEAVASTGLDPGILDGDKEHDDDLVSAIEKPATPAKYQKDLDGLSLAVETLKNLASLADLCPYRRGLKAIDEAYCIQPNKWSIHSLYSLLGNLTNIPDEPSAPASGDEEKKKEEMVVYILHLLKSNLCRLVDAKVNPKAVGLEVLKDSQDFFPGVKSPLTATDTKEIGCGNLFPLRHLLEGLVGIHVIDGISVSREVSDTAAQALRSGLVVLYPLALDRVRLLMSLLDLYLRSRCPPTSVPFSLLWNLLLDFSSSRNCGVVSLLPASALDATGSLSADQEREQYREVDRMISTLVELVATRCHQKITQGSQNEVGRQDIPEDNKVLDAACALLSSYQEHLLAEALELTGRLRHLEPELLAKKIQVQQSVVSYSLLLTRHCRAVLTSVNMVVGPGAGEEERKRKVESTLKFSFVGTLVPPLSAALCLLRRQPWLAQPILPAVIGLVESLDTLNCQLAEVRATETRLCKFEASAECVEVEGSSEQRKVQNVFRRLYTGDKDHFDGQIGFQFEANSSFSISGLGRSVNPQYNNGVLLKSHKIRLWDEQTQSLIAETAVSGHSKKDHLGYAYCRLTKPVQIIAGKRYRLTSHEYSQSGDPWYKKEDRPDEEYDKELISILRDCYISGGSTSYPNNQNLHKAPYGVPTFYVDSEGASLLPSTSAPSYGVPDLRLSEEWKSPNVALSHEGSCATVNGSSQVWATAITKNSFASGVHDLEFQIIRNAAGHLVLGVLSQYGTTCSSGRYRLGDSVHSLGWVVETGTLLWNGRPYASQYKAIPDLATGAVIGMTLDLDRSSLSFSYNGSDLGVAISASSFLPDGRIPALNHWLPGAIHPGFSLLSENDAVRVRPGGFAGSTMDLHWLLDLEKTLASLGGRLAATMIAGTPADDDEEELAPWLQSSLLSGGMKAHAEEGRQVSSEWVRKYNEEKQRVKPVLDRISSKSGLSTLGGSSLTLSMVSGASFKEEEERGERNKERDSSMSKELQRFLSSLSEDLSDSGPAAVLISWMSGQWPDRSVLRLLGAFPRSERIYLAALARYLPEELSLYLMTHAETADETEIDPAHSSAVLSVWNAVLEVRHWLIKCRQGFRAKEQGEGGEESKTANDGEDQGGEETKGGEEETKSGETADEKEKEDPLRVILTSSPVFTGSSSAYALDGDAASFSLDGGKEEDSPPSFKHLQLPTSFQELEDHLFARAKFICTLAPPTSDMRKSSLLLSQMARLWADQSQGPNMLQPMQERWQTVSEEDSSRWQGVIGVLRAQHLWRNNSNSDLQSVKAVEATQERETPSGEEEGWLAVVKACGLYIKNGAGAPPHILRKLMERRRRRAESRIYGFYAMQALLSSISFNSAKHDTLLFLRPALRGFTEGEKEAREGEGGVHVAGGFRPTLRHHHLKHLEGCPKHLLYAVRKSFTALYGDLAEMIQRSETVLDSGLTRALLCAWALDFEAQDHEFILRSGILPSLQSLISLSSLSAEATQVIASIDALMGGTEVEAQEPKEGSVSPLSELRLPRKAPRLSRAPLSVISLPRRPALEPPTSFLPRAEGTASPASISKVRISDSERYELASQWQPYVEDYIAANVKAGSFPKRELLRHMLCAPQKALPRSWYQAHGLQGRGRQVLSSLTASALVVLYGQFRKSMQGRQLLSSPSVAASPLHHPQGKSHSLYLDATQNSYIEIGQIGELTEFTMEMWLCPESVTGTQAIRTERENGLGSVSLFLVDGQVQLSIKGNEPHHTRFNLSLLPHQWAHLAVSYSATLKSATLYVTDHLCPSRHARESVSFKSTTPIIHLRQSRFGGSFAPNQPSKPAVHGFTGFLSEIRLWDQSLSPSDLDENMYRRLILTGRSHADSRTLSHLIGLWPVSEGQGNRLHDASTTLNSSRLEEAPRHATLTDCLWRNERPPLFEGQLRIGFSWEVFLTSLSRLQRWFRQWHRWKQIGQRGSKSMFEKEAKLAGATSLEEGEEEEYTDDYDRGKEVSGSPIGQLGGGGGAVGHHEPVGLKIFISQAEKWTKDHRYQLLQLRTCAATVFQLITTIAMSGNMGSRRETETVSAAAAAKRKRRQKARERESDLKQQIGGEAPPETVNPAVEEEKTKAEAASAAAQDAAMSASAGGEKGAQALWFTMELQRKALELLEKELDLGANILQEAEGLLRAQRPPMLRSLSTPAVSGRLPNTVGTSHPLEPVELESILFRHLLFLYSLRDTAGGRSHLSRVALLRHLFILLRLGSPRMQRLVLGLLGSLSNVLDPRSVASILGSDSSLLDLLVDRISDALWVDSSTAVLFSKEGQGQGVTGSSLPSSLPSASDTLSALSGFRSGYVAQALAAESVALLRKLSREKQWSHQVMAVLAVALRNGAPLVREMTRPMEGVDNGKAYSLLQRATLSRANAALAVLGGYADCLRVGGTVEVSSEERDGLTRATLIEFVPDKPAGLVLFDALYDSAADPTHNVQQVGLSSLSPVESQAPPSLYLSPEFIQLFIAFLAIPDLPSRQSDSIIQDQMLWLAQIKSRSLLSLQRILAQDSSAKVALRVGELLKALCQVAMLPVRLSSFVALRHLQERSRVLQARLLEVSSSPAGELMFKALSPPKAVVDAAGEEVARDGAAQVQQVEEPPQEETEQQRQRRQMAGDLAAMGFEVELCMVALERNRDDLTGAIDWLTSAEADVVRATLYQPVSTASGAGGGGTREDLALELGGISGMPHDLVLKALEMFGDDPNQSMGWLMDSGRRYLSSLSSTKDQDWKEEGCELSDLAALEDVQAQAAEQLFTESDEDGAGEERRERRSGSGSETAGGEAEVHLAPIVAETSPGHPAPLEEGYLPEGILLTVSEEMGPVERMPLSGRTGALVLSTPSSVRLRILNIENGFSEEYVFSPDCVRRFTRLYEEPLDGSGGIRRLMYATEAALGSHYARRALVALLSAWPKSSEDEKMEVAKDHAQEISLPRFSAEVFGGPHRLVDLVKLLAASENVFKERRGGKASSSSSSQLPQSLSKDYLASPQSEVFDFAGAKAPSSSSSLMELLRNKMLQILREEALHSEDESTERTMEEAESDDDHEEESKDAGDISPTSSLLKEAQEQSVGEAHVPVPSEPHLDRSIALSELDVAAWLGEDADDDLARAIALSMEGVPLPPASTPSSVTPPSAPAVPGAQHPSPLGHASQSTGVKSKKKERSTALPPIQDAMLENSEESKLLSRILVKECVSHFLASTKVADAETETEVFESLHPYFPRCNYKGEVKRHKEENGGEATALRVTFDSRCKLGPKASLTFYSDSEMTKAITTFTGESAVFRPTVIHLNKFWFRFSASEESTEGEYGWGFRFYVRPMSSIKWTSEEEVLSSPSLEWACWVLDFLLNDANKLVKEGAVHNKMVCDALVRYLRSPGAPYKNRVISLLAQLLRQADHFPKKQRPRLTSLKHIAALVFDAASELKAASTVILPRRLLELLEMSMAVNRAADVFEDGPRRIKYISHDASSNNGATQAGEREMKEEEEMKTEVDTLSSTTISVPIKVADLPLAQVLQDVVDLLDAFHSIIQLPDRFINEAWLDARGGVGIVESHHPYVAGESKHGSYKGSEGSTGLRLRFEPRSALGTRCSLVVRGPDGNEILSVHAKEGENGVSAESWPLGVIDVNGGSVSYEFSVDMEANNADGLWGFAFTITELGASDEAKLRKFSKEEGLAVLSEMSKWTVPMDMQFMEWVNAKAETSSTASTELKPTDIRLVPQLDELRCSLLVELPLPCLHIRFALLRCLNLRVQRCIEFLDVKDTESPWTLGYKLRQLAHCICTDVKLKHLEALVDATWEASDNNNNGAAITLDRMKALESQDEGETEPSVSQCFFGQAFRQLKDVDTALLRRRIDNKGRLFNVKFRGEEGVDWGGVYREGVNSIVDDLFSNRISLLVLCPNGQHDTGVNRGKYLPNPKCVSPVALQMFEFMGKLMGISLRTKGDFPFELPSLVWKKLVGQAVDRSDLEATDVMLLQMLDGIRNCTADGITDQQQFEEAFSDLELSFVVASCSSSEVELLPGGREKKVTFENRVIYCDMVEYFRLNECNEQIKALQRGMASIVPMRGLKLLTWQELELATCGSPKIDVAVWRKHTRYDGYEEDDLTVNLFWKVMSSFSDEQRADFVRFCWGRSRLPRGRWTQPFKVSKKGGRDAVNSLPVAHTCFFSLELPPYRTEEKMRQMLLATINFGMGGILMA